MENLKYEYYLYTWGGFYNEQHKLIHKQESGAKWFDSLEERDNYIINLKKIEQELNARHLAFTTSEGYYTRIPVVLHRISKYKDQIVYTKNELLPDTEFEGAKYILEWKWYPGNNDYPFGEDIDYLDDKNFSIVQEWVSGCFSID